MSAPLCADLQGILARWQARGKRTVSLSPGVAEAFFRREPARSLAPPLTPPTKPAAPSPRPPVRQAVPAPAPRPAPVLSPVTANAVAAMGWEELAAAVADCQGCPLCAGRTRTVFGAGDTRARLMFIGEGPGYDEDQQGIPFVGKAGQLLTKMIQAMQFAREEVYIANIVKCRPPENRNPEPGEAAACLPYLRRQIELIRPEVIVLLGAVPLRELIGGRSITRERGQWREYEGIPVMPTFHPSYLLRVPTAKRDVWADLQQVMLRLGKNPEDTQARRQAH
ncbi:MAG: uracil-DNA glycosylase [Lentisphaeria bacterium]|nr:uracil-DNA glycosylase [Lentisphaeria bacterium]